MPHSQTLSAIFAGPARDNGFYESGLLGAQAGCADTGLAFRWRERIGPGADALAQAAREAAQEAPALLLVHGGSSDRAVAAVAPEFPGIQFLSTHGEHAGPNFSCFNIRQPQSAFLAGALAALTTRSGVVGHLSGIRITPGLDARAAWAQGVQHIDAGLRIVSCFCGTQDDNAVSHTATLREIDEGVDVLYTMLNFGRTGAIDACRERGVAQIGNVIDWCAVHPEVFIASAVANNGRGVRRWVQDVVSGRLRTGEVRWLGMEDPEAVRLVVSDRVPASTQARLQTLSDALVRGEIALTTQFTGPEFSAAR